MTFAKIEQALTAIRSGELVVVVAEAGQQPGEPALQPSLVMSAQCATREATELMLRHARGPLYVSLTPERSDALSLPLTAAGEAHSLSLRGESHADDRSSTVRALAGTLYQARDFVHPGHVVPLRPAAHGVLERPAPAEAALDLARLAGHPAAAALCEIAAAQRSFAARYGFLIVDIAELVAYRLRTEAWSRSALATEEV